MTLSDAIGWIGSLLILVSYAQVALQRWTIRSKPSQLGNLFGSIFLVINSVTYQAWVPATLNALWALICLKTLFQLRQTRK